MPKIVPKVIHICMSGRNGKLCGAGAENWDEKWLSDKKAKTLPTCPACLEAKEKILTEEEE